MTAGPAYAYPSQKRSDYFRVDWLPCGLLELLGDRLFPRQSRLRLADWHDDLSRLHSVLRRDLLQESAS
jgi:hypothetical protein